MKPNSNLSVLILDVDPLARQALRTVIQEVPGVEVVASCPTLETAKARLLGQRVDVITVDVNLKRDNSLDILPWLQANCPSVIPALFIQEEQHQLRTSVDAMVMGAAGLFFKGRDGQANAFPEFQKFIEQLKKDICLDGPSSSVTGHSTPPAKMPTKETKGLTGKLELLAIGASTGGPPVVLQVLKDLPPSFTTPVVITQHMGSQHIPFFVQMLADQCGRPVTIAKDGEVVEKNRVYIAGNAKHLLISRVNGALVLHEDDGPEEHNCKPAVDPMFRSVAATCGGRCIAVVLTGMGSDGAKGALALKERGCPIVVQDKESSVVWGMPGATVALGAADQVVPATQVVPQILNWISAYA